MSDHDRIIDQFVGEFESHLAGSGDSRTRACAELAEHLAGAAAAGELEQTLERMGGPRRAAASFNREVALPAAPFSRRLQAAAVDNLPLILVTVALALEPLLLGLGNSTLTFPPFSYLEFSIGRFSGCVALVPVTCGVYQPGWLYGLGLPLALAWSIVGLGVLESRIAQTPGKRLVGLRVTDVDGLRISVRAGIVRRLSFLTGPLAWLDWVPFLKGEERRIFDWIAATRVVEEVASSAPES